MHIPYTCTYYFNACQINGIHDKLWINSNGNSILQKYDLFYRNMTCNTCHTCLTIFKVPVCLVNSY